MPFFADLPPEEDHRDAFPALRVMPWAGPPPGAVPAIVPVEALVARTDAVAIVVECVRVYPESFTFDLVLLANPDRSDRDGPGLIAATHDGPYGEGSPPAEQLRIGIAFPDGRRATNDPGSDHGGGPPEAGLRMRSRSGGGSDRRMSAAQWVWPLPPDGPVTIVCAWAAQGIPESVVELDGAAIRAAADRALVVFSDEHLPEEPPEDATGWARYRAC